MTNIIAGITKDLKAVPKKLKEKAKSADVKKLILLNLPYVLAGYFCNKAAFLWRVAEGSNASDKMMVVMSQMDRMFSNPFPSFFLSDLLIGIAGGVALKFIVYYKAKNAKKFRQGVEYGSARWGNAKDIEPYMDSVFENNILLTATERLMMSGRPKEPKYARNKNILVIGGSGSSKTRFFVKPNLMQMHSSYVVTDPKGTVLMLGSALLYWSITWMDILRIIPTTTMQRTCIITCWINGNSAGLWIRQRSTGQKNLKIMNGH